MKHVANEPADAGRSELSKREWKDSIAQKLTLTALSQEGVGTIAINDSFLIESAIYKLLKRHFRPESYYVDLLELMHEVGMAGS